jgi:hypothetical protein
LTADNKHNTPVFKGLEIPNPLTLLYLLDDSLREGRVKLHDWQVEILKDFSCEEWSDQNPFQVIVRACNGSGKDKFIIAPCAVWIAMAFRKSIVVVTSASGQQLDRQTCRYIKELCDAANRSFGFQLWDCKYREYTINFDDNIGNQSHIYCFATDEPGKAEGHHPADYGSKLVILVSEDKTVPDEINVALNKCTGYTHRVHVSTPGASKGHFYNLSQIAVKRKLLSDIRNKQPTDWIEYHITADQCSHLSVNYIEQMKRDLGGENSPAFRSQVNAEFTEGDEMIVIQHSSVWNCMYKSRAKWKQEVFNTAGLDLADNVAENVLCVRNGNKLIATEAFRIIDDEERIKHIVQLLHKYNLNKEGARIFGDAVGLGKPILSRLKALGWSNIRFIDSRNSSRKPRTYRNVATELWFNTRTLIDRGELIIKPDDRLLMQLSTRYYKLVDGAIHQVLSKQEQRSKGLESPDRADSFNLAFWNYESIFEESLEVAEKPFEIEEVKEVKPSFDYRVAVANSKHKFQTKSGKKIDLKFLQDDLAEYKKQNKKKKEQNEAVSNVWLQGS